MKEIDNTAEFEELKNGLDSLKEHIANKQEQIDQQQLQQLIKKRKTLSRCVLIYEYAHSLVLIIIMSLLWWYDYITAWVAAFGIVLSAIEGVKLMCSKKVNSEGKILDTIRDRKLNKMIASISFILWIIFSITFFTTFILYNLNKPEFNQEYSFMEYTTTALLGAVILFVLIQLPKRLGMARRSIKKQIDTINNID